MLIPKPVPALLAVLSAASPLLAQDAPRQGLIKPIWISALPERPGRVYAMGLAAFAPSEAQALKQASQNARVEVLTRLRANVKGETTVNSQSSFTKELGGTTTGSSSQRVSQDSQIRTQAMDLPGLAVEETWSDLDGRTAYALAYLDVSAAERELRTRFETARKDLALDGENPVDPRERLRKLQRVKKAQDELGKLDDLAALLAAGGGDPALRSDIRSQRLALDRRAEALRATLIFCLRDDKDAAVRSEYTSLVRNAVLKQGLGWAEASGEFYLSIRYSGDRSGWKIDKNQRWDYQQSADFLVARGVLEISLSDSKGTQYESTTLEAKGVGVSEYAADRALIKEFKAKLETTVRQWLESLAN